MIQRGLVAVDLFCGAGGLSVGLVEAGFRVSYAADAWPLAVESYNLNFDHQAVVADLGAPDPSRAIPKDMEIDLICGGPPCQGFSIQRIGPDIDPRNDLVLAFGRFVRAVNPKAFLMENVTGLLGKRGLPVFERFCALTENAGYQIEAMILNALDFGVPQARRRVFVLGTRRDRGRPFTFPTGASDRNTTVREAIGDLPRPWPKTHAGKCDPLHKMIGMSPLNQKRIEMIPPGGGFEDLPVEMRVACHKNGASRIGHRAVYGRLSPDEPAGTITARFDSFTRGRFGHPWEPRNITLREGARIQTFPDSHRFAGNQEDIAAQIGNAVPPLMAAAILRSLAQQMESRHRAENAA
jgi:DNA (cytosine-5)-methyltransferase 1